SCRHPGACCPTARRGASGSGARCSASSGDGRETTAMSRIGKKPIAVPKGVQIAVKGDHVEVQGPKGKLGLTVHQLCSVQIADGTIVVHRAGDHRTAKAIHGLTRALVANMVRGVTEGFERKLEIVGIGYRAQLAGRALTFSLGYSHQIVFPLPEGVQAEV